MQKRIKGTETSKVCCFSLMGILFFCLFSYGYFVREVTVNIVARQNMENELSALSSGVLTLETEYIKAKTAVTPELAKEQGFISASPAKFVTKGATHPGLSLVTPNL